jgi:hypothetical protein
MEETVNDLEEQARWLREECHGIDSWHPMSLEEDRLPYSLANVLKPHPLLRWAFYVAVGAAVALFITLLLL